MITFYASSGRASRLEEMICCLSTDTIDIDQVTILCRQYNLYDALIYVWTRAIGDFITPLISLLSMVKVVDYGDDGSNEQDIYMASAMKIFPYMAYTFTGRVYPGGAPMDEEQSYAAKKDMYRFLFSGDTIAWPPGSDDVFKTRDQGKEPTFPYLRLILEFDASSFMSMLNEAFEDSFLNEDQDVANGNQSNGARRGASPTPTRQSIINTLLGIMTPDEFDAEDIIYFYMFIARNLPKYPQHILLPGTSLHKILVGLCDCPTELIKDDCQLSVEYLLSVYHPPNLQSLVPLFEKTGYHRVLKSVYRDSQQYAKLVDTYLNDTESQDEVFGCIADCFRVNRGLTAKQLKEVKSVIKERASDLAAVDAARAALTLQQYALELLEPVLDALEGESEVQYKYLKALIEPEDPTTGETRQPAESLPSNFTERYVQLMCKYHGAHVADFVSLLKSGDLELDSVLPALEQSGIVDAAVILMARDGLVKGAMDRLVKHLSTLETALTGLVSAAAETPDAANTEEAVHDLLDDIQKYVRVGIWLSQGQTRSMQRTSESFPDRRKSAYGDVREEDLALDEVLWLDLVDRVVTLAKEASAAIAELEGALSAATPQLKPIDTGKITATLRSSVQQVFSALLASTSLPAQKTNTPVRPTSDHGRPQRPRSNPQTNPSFLRVLRTFLTRATHSSPSLSDLRAVLQEIFAAYTFEETILSLANRFLDKEGFEAVKELTELRQRGWRPRGQVCEGCGKRTWGPGAGSTIWESWEKREIERQRKRLEEATGGKGKGKSTRQGEEEGAEDANVGPLVVFACRHMWHRSCLDKAVGDDADRRRPKCPLCV
jgi:hypothetical protein